MTLQSTDETPAANSVDLREIAFAIFSRRKLILLGTIIAGVIGFAVACAIPPTYTARTLLMPPQQQQSAAAAALNSLGALAGIAGNTAGIKNPAEQYITLMQSATVADQIIDQFGLMKVYENNFRADARKTLSARTLITSGKKDGLITVEFDDSDPTRAANVANAYVSSLRQLMTRLAVTEAQQRRVFFENKLTEAKNELTKAQIGLQTSGFNPGALKAEPKSAADGYARLRAEAVASEIKLQSMRRTLTDEAPAVQQQQAILAALRTELARQEKRDESQNADSGTGADYITKYREFKYQEALFDLFARQYEAARLDESREGTLIQVIDAATPPERKSKPKRASIALFSAFGGAVLLCIFAAIHHLRPSSTSPSTT